MFKKNLIQMNSTATELETAINEESDSNAGSQSVSEKNDDIMTSRKDDPPLNEIQYGRRRRWIWFLPTVVIVSIIVLSLSYLLKGSNTKQNKCNEEFTKHAKEIEQTTINKISIIIYMLEGISESVTTSALTVNAEWPFFQLDVFEQLANKVLNKQQPTGIETVSIANQVMFDQRDQWILYSNQKFYDNITNQYLDKATTTTTGSEYHPFITRFERAEFVFDYQVQNAFPLWGQSPPMSSYETMNWNLMSVKDFQIPINMLLDLKNRTILSAVTPYTSIVDDGRVMTTNNVDNINIIKSPGSIVFHPIMKSFDESNSTIVAMLAANLNWQTFLDGILSPSVIDMYVVLNNTCGQSYTFSVKDGNYELVGEGSLHDRRYHNLEYTIALDSKTTNSLWITECEFSLHLFPMSEGIIQRNTVSPFIILLGVSICVLCIVVFYIICRVHRSDDNKEIGGKEIEIAPAAVEESAAVFVENSQERKSLANIGSIDAVIRTKPDIFLETTVLFADLVGFSAWSSVRHPNQVFSLLETLFERFDEIASRRRIFKVETVRDCYVAVSGLPEARKDHAIVMARYSIDIMNKTEQLTRELETTLGPDTGDLSLRIGLHSGPVTAGVLSSRLQLFGDTMNMLAHIESTGESGRIHLSAETADLIIKAGKRNWIEKRKDNVVLHGKGTSQTYWLVSSAVDTFRRRLSAQHNLGDNGKRTVRLVEWNTEILLNLLKQVVAMRQLRSPVSNQIVDAAVEVTKTSSFLDEVTDIIALPEFEKRFSHRWEDIATIDIPKAAGQLRDYVFMISALYNDNDFHNFEHASHVMMSVVKLLSRIVSPSELKLDTDGDAEQLHDHTYGITSDPLTQFACAVGALIHDVHHSGVPNAQLIKENLPIASKYDNRSIAEQYSLDLSWDLLMDKKFQDLRLAIMPTDEESRRFRQILVNVVMATDIVDKDLKLLRNRRWETAFSNNSADGIIEINLRDQINRKATIVIDYLIQASDVSHTMQHWHVYRKWNERFFKECYTAYLDGRAETNPADNWYQGELGFFDFYIIPLAKKLKECGVFGKCSGEYLDYAIRNRQEWEAKGMEVVARMVASVPKETIDE